MTALPPHVAAAARDAAAQLRAALLPQMTAATPAGPEADALWFAAKLLSAAAGELDNPDAPADVQRRARWEEVAGCASAITDYALTAAADGLDLRQAGARLLDADVLAQEVPDGALAYAGVIEVTPPDFLTTERTLTVAIGGTSRTLTVTADRGTVPAPRAHTPATLLRTSHHLHRLAKVIGEVVLEPGEYGIPMCGSPDTLITCAICTRTVGADIARTIEIYTPGEIYTPARDLTVCSTTCARAAAAGEHADLHDDQP